MRDMPAASASYARAQKMFARFSFLCSRHADAHATAVLCFCTADGPPFPIFAAAHAAIRLAVSPISDTLARQRETRG